jgi:hypothetical protein
MPLLGRCLRSIERFFSDFMPEPGWCWRLAASFGVRGPKCTFCKKVSTLSFAVSESIEAGCYLVDTVPI